MTDAVENQDLNPAALAGFEATTALGIHEMEVGAAAAIAREEAEIKGQIFQARRFPRDEFRSYNQIIKSCSRPRFAEDALYSFPRGSQRVKGPSVQLARELARSWGNVRYGMRVVSVDEDMVHIKGFAHDLESNAYVEMEDKFEKLIQRKRGGETVWVKPDERDLRELVNRRGAILVRNAILQVIPSDVTEGAVEQVEETLRKAAAGEIQQDREGRIRRLVKAFDELGVSVDMLTEYLGHDLDAITADEIADLQGVFKSIRDGHTKREEHFNIKAGSKAAKDLTETLKAGKGKKAESGEPKDAEQAQQEALV